MENFGTINYTVAALAFLTFASVLLGKLKQGVQVINLFIALLLSSVWAGIAAYQASGAYFESLTLEVMESLRNIAWIIFLYILLLLFPPYFQQNRKIQLREFHRCIRGASNRNSDMEKHL